MTAILANVFVVVINLFNIQFQKNIFLRAAMMIMIYINLSCVFIMLHQVDLRDSLNEQIIEAKDKTILNQDTIINLQDRIIKRLESK